jgi:thiamine biosynthesis lipoprotein
MGSRLTLTLLELEGPQRRLARQAWRIASEEFDEVDRVMSRFRADSAITTLNELAGSGVIVPIEPRLYAALATAYRAWRSTSGLFDPRVLGHLERLGSVGAGLHSNRRQPADSGDSSEPWLCRWPRQRAARLAEPLDLGGIGKGLALRWAWERIKRVLPLDGRAGALLDAGGDLVVGGPSPDAGPWLVGIENPADGDEPMAVVAIDRGGLCTSSTRVARWTDAEGRSVHHLIDPRTGEPGGMGLASVTVALPDPAWAEIWSKALFLTGPEAIAASARRRGLAAWWVDEGGQLSMTAAARAMTVWP